MTLHDNQTRALEKEVGILARWYLFRVGRSHRLNFWCVESGDPTRGARLLLEKILTELKTQRDRLTQAIAALEGATATKRRRTKRQTTGKRNRRRMSAATRKRLSEAKRKWWAERKKKAKGA